MLGALVREPMIHFLVIGMVIFGIQALLGKPQGGESAVGNRIVITEGRIRQLAEVFSRTWQRPPTPVELNGLLEAFIKEEVYYREALRLGLDRDDTLVRRRMQQKMEFLIEPDDSVLEATDAQLKAYLDARRDLFRIQPKVGFRQVFVSSESKNPKARAVAMLEALRAAPADLNPAEVGDNTMLPSAMAPTPLDEIARNFGQAFANVLGDLPRERWAGPVKSTYGLHIVQITDYREAYDPPFDDIREEVESRWRQEQRTRYLRSEYERLRSRYNIVMKVERPRALTE